MAQKVLSTHPENSHILRMKLEALERATWSKECFYYNPTKNTKTADNVLKILTTLFQGHWQICLLYLAGFVPLCQLLRPGNWFYLVRLVHLVWLVWLVLLVVCHCVDCWDLGIGLFGFQFIDSNSDVGEEPSNFFFGNF